MSTLTTKNSANNHFQTMSDIEKRMDNLISVNKNAEAWQKIKKGFDVVKNCSFVSSSGYIAGAMTVVSYNIMQNANVLQEMGITLNQVVITGLLTMSASIISNSMSRFIENKLDTASVKVKNGRNDIHEKIDTMEQEILKIGKESHNKVIQKKIETFKELAEHVKNTDLITPVEKEKQKNIKNRRKP